MSKVFKSLERSAKKVLFAILKLFSHSSQNIVILPDADAIRSVLIIRVDGKMGNMVLTLPMIQAAKNLFKSAHITVLMDQRQKRLLENIPFINECIVYEWKRYLKYPWLWFSFLKNIRGYNLVVECSNPGSFSVSHALLLVLTGSKYRLGFDRGESNKFLNLLVPLNTEKHYREMMLDLIRIFNQPLFHSLPYIVPTEVEKMNGRNFLIGTSYNLGNKYIGIWVGARHQKQWQIENYFLIAKQLEEISGATVLFLFGLEERKIYEKLDKDKRERARLFTDVRLLASAMLVCDLIISGDTGPLHLSVTLGRPTLGLFSLLNMHTYGYDDGKVNRMLYLPG
ncbi:MAG: hypothetical protein M1426_04290, partial [Patescibacteria group bacterium]|nr:hypothetical protein [Patescibacteria group bacterium]